MSALATLLTLERLRLARGRALTFALVTTGLVVLLALAARQAGTASGTQIEDQTGNLGLIRFLALLMPCAFAAGAINDELAARTLVYLTVRPMPRAYVVLGKWLAAGLASAAALTSAALLVHVASGAFTPEGVFSGLGHTLAIAGAAVLESLVCTGICLTFGTVAARGGSMLAFAFIAFFEFLLSFAPGRLRLFSMAHHALAFAGLDSGGLTLLETPALSRMVHGVLLVVVALGWLVSAALIFSMREYRGSEGE